VSPQDFRDMIAKVKASIGQPLVLQEHVEFIPARMMRDGETPGEALARWRADRTREIIRDGEPR
jgi:hypothetical protein